MPAITDKVYYGSISYVVDSSAITEGKFVITHKVDKASEILPYILLFKGSINDAAGKTVDSKLKTAIETAIGKKFPDIEVQMVTLDKVVLSPLDPKHKYVFIDFWFHSCAPCIAEFPALQELYDEFR